MERYTGVSAAAAPAAAKRAKATAEQPEGRAGRRAARAAEAVARRGPVMSAQQLSDAALLVQKQIDAAKQAQQPEPQPEPEPPEPNSGPQKSLRKRNKKRAD